ncbi:hypothetical protein OAM01_01890 [bacterium]|nr:hypothetical protein [bacterium]
MDTSWSTHEDQNCLSIVHDNRWLAIIGLPLALVGLAVATGPWFIDDARNSGAWPILAVGSVIGFGIIVAGVSLCFKYERIDTDRATNLLERHKGMPPFRRSMTWPLKNFTEVKVVVEKMDSASGHGSSLHQRFRLVGPNASILIASCLEPEPIQTEAQRWAKFLDLRLDDGTDVDCQNKAPLRQKKL